MYTHEELHTYTRVIHTMPDTVIPCQPRRRIRQRADAHPALVRGEERERERERLRPRGDVSAWSPFHATSARSFLDETRVVDRGRGSMEPEPRGTLRRLFALSRPMDGSQGYEPHTLYTPSASRGAGSSESHHISPRREEQIPPQCPNSAGRAKRRHAGAAACRILAPSLGPPTVPTGPT